MRLASWQFWGRRQERDAGVAALSGETPGRGVLVIGPPGVGKSRLADEIARVAAGEHGIAAARAAVSDPIATTALTEGSPVVLTARSGSPLPDPVAAAVAEERIVVVPVAALTRAEMTEALGVALGGAPSARLVGTLWRQSHGVFAVLVALVDEAVRTGAISPSKIGWDLTTDLNPAVLTARIDARLAALDPGDRDLLEYIVAGEPLPVGQATAFAGGEAAVARLRDLGYLSADELGRVRAAPPAVADCIRAMIPPERREAHDRRLLQALRDGDPPGEGSVRPVLWALRTGRTVPAAVALATATAANAVHDNAAALAIATAVADAPDSAGVPRVLLLLQAAAAARRLDRLDDALLLLDRVDRELARLAPDAVGREGGEDLRVAALAARADVVHAQQRDVRAGLRVLEAGMAALADDPAVVAELRGHRILHLAYAGRFREADEQYPDARPLRSPLRQRVDAMHAMVLVARGRPAEAAARLRSTARATKDLPDAAWVIEELSAVGFLAVLRSEGIPAALQAVAGAAVNDRSASVRMDDGVRQVAEAEVALVAGDARRALAAAQDAAWTVQVDGPADFLPRPMSQLAEAFALAGDQAAARRAAQRYRALPGVGNHVLHADGELSLLVVDLAGAGADTAAARRLANRFRQDGLAGAAARALHLAVTRGDLEAARELVELAPELDGTVHRLCHQHAEALLAGDSAALLALSGGFQRIGHVRTAAEVAVQAERMADAAGRGDLAREAAHTGSMLWALLGEAPDRAVQLTGREKEIAALVAQGLSNRDIAASLVVSVRTVEGHLGRMYTKLGIPGRSALTPERLRQAVVH